jgi:threonine dehydrogenase-like Zn-dependent dehydrogenase
MKAVCWYGKEDVRVENVPDPAIKDPKDTILRITTTAICGSDLHLYGGFIPQMQKGDVLGHEFMGEVVEAGPESTLAKGDRVVVPFDISCGECWYCRQKLFSLCQRTNPDAEKLAKLYGYPGAGLFGYSHLYGGYPGGQAEYVRVPYSNVGPVKVPASLTDEQVLFLSDIFPTGYMAAENCNIHEGDVVAVWGCGPVGQMAIRSAYLLGARLVIAIDRVPERLEMAKRGGAETIDYEDDKDVVERLKDLTDGRGPDACIDAVGVEAHGTGIGHIYDEVKSVLKLETDRPTALRQAIQGCRPGGTISIPGVYGGFIDKVNMGAAFGKGLTFHMGQTHTQRYMKPLLERIEKGEIDPSFVITHRLNLDDAPDAYKTFREK